MGERKNIALVCSECGTRNYKTTKSKKDAGERFKIKKYCPKCDKHLEHIESR